MYPNQGNLVPFPIDPTLAVGMTPNPNNSYTQFYQGSTQPPMLTDQTYGISQANIYANISGYNQPHIITPSAPPEPYSQSTNSSISTQSYKYGYLSQPMNYSNTNQAILPPQNIPYEGQYHPTGLIELQPQYPPTGSNQLQSNYYPTGSTQLQPHYPPTGSNPLQSQYPQIGFNQSLPPYTPACSISGANQYPLTDLNQIQTPYPQMFSHPAPTEYPFTGSDLHQPLNPAAGSYPGSNQYFSTGLTNPENLSYSQGAYAQTNQYPPSVQNQSQFVHPSPNVYPQSSPYPNQGYPTDAYGVQYPPTSYGTGQICTCGMNATMNQSMSSYTKNPQNPCPVHYKRNTYSSHLDIGANKAIKKAVKTYKKLFK